MTALHVGDSVILRGQRLKLRDLGLRIGANQEVIYRTCGAISLKGKAVKPLTPIATREPTPREIIAEDYKCELPIRGGWGYTQANACVIDKNDPAASQRIPFNGVAIEHIFVEKRIYEEMIIFRSDGEKFAGIKWSLLTQRLIIEAGHVYDKLEFNITAFSGADWEVLRAEWEGPNGFRSPAFDQSAHERKSEQCMISITRDFWFDIASFYGK